MVNQNECGLDFRGTFCTSQQNGGERAKDPTPLVTLSVDMSDRLMETCRY